MASKPNKEEQELMNQYPYIVAAGRYFGSNGYYIVSECSKAKAAKAPADTWEMSAEGPRTVSTIQNPEFIAALEAYKNGTRGGVIIEF